MAFTARLAESVESQAKAYAAHVGLSLNALLTVALREYLDARMPAPAGSIRSPRREPPAVVVPVGRSRSVVVGVPMPAPSPVGVDAQKPAFKPPASRSDPCPCGAADLNGYRLKWKHCHGKVG